MTGFAGGTTVSWHNDPNFPPALPQQETAGPVNPTQNLEICFAGIGDHVTGDVVPRYWLDVHKHPVERWLSDGWLKYTDRPVTKPHALFPPAGAKKEVDPTAELQAEIKRLTEENEAHELSRKNQAGMIEGLQRETGAKDVALGQQAVEINRLQGLLTQRDAEIAGLRADLEQATAPAGDSPTGKTKRVAA